MGFFNLPCSNCQSLLTTVRYVELTLRGLTLPIAHKISWHQQQTGILSLKTDPDGIFQQ